MTTDQLESLKYPIGKFQWPVNTSPDQVKDWIEQIEALPARLRQLVSNLSSDQLDTPYRPEGWTVRQVVHHIPDSHVNGYVRFKWALTEDRPVIKVYEEQHWAELPDSKSAPVEHSLLLLEALHAKWTYLLKGLSVEDFGREYIHPETGRSIPLAAGTALYAWHGEHHYMHIKQLLEVNGW
ncbi:bacillithiol transferase BstA [Fulvivirga kasyanovii]|uniref:Metal-dependent hydrolase n=1 Tax=Fulvivirga kasyanovii TaxID=396812 RepID=A0ABW9RXA1_9BACT|nr:putative metal-dependent hydrolase [Fulvivirga kasyanovii]MTI28853.1 putative metal-dependent hydrolase [Fulvivirga kasyanovii]